MNDSVQVNIHTGAMTPRAHEMVTEAIGQIENAAHWWCHRHLCSAPDFAGGVNGRFWPNLDAREWLVTTRPRVFALG
jgi:hypothetical protein